MTSKEHAKKAREVLEASDKVVVALKKWKAAPTAQNRIAYIDTRVEYLEEQLEMEELMRERLEKRVKALEEQVGRDSAGRSPMEKRVKALEEQLGIGE